MMADIWTADWGNDFNQWTRARTLETKELLWESKIFKNVILFFVATICVASTVPSESIVSEWKNSVTKNLKLIIYHLTAAVSRLHRFKTESSAHRNKPAMPVLLIPETYLCSTSQQYFHYDAISASKYPQSLHNYPIPLHTPFPPSTPLMQNCRHI